MYIHSKFLCSIVLFKRPVHFDAHSLECTITWNNVESLMNISNKLCVPALQRECLTFLLTHAAGKPIKAMRIAELFEEEELYRESSRFVLDNPGGWSEHELSTLSQETLLKLEKRCADFLAVAGSSCTHKVYYSRNWFLERVLKLGLTMVAKEYQCVSFVCSYFSTQRTAKMVSVQHVPTLPRAHVSSRKNGDRRIMPSFVLVKSIPFKIHWRLNVIQYLNRTTSALHGLSIPPDVGRC